MKQIYKLLVLWVILMGAVLMGQSQQKAFPGAEGAGSYASGGRGTVDQMTKVFEVTNLTDVNSPGSLRYACSQSIATYPYRTIVFRVSGTIHLNSKLNIPGNTTIAGQTAPGGGICIADYPVSLSGNNIILRYLRIRLGDKNQLKTTPAGCGLPVAPFSDACKPIDGSGGDDALGDLGHKNIIVDHCSVSWSNDEALTMYRGDSLTIQWSVIAEPLNYSYHFESGDTDFENHGYGGIWGAQHATFHHNLLAHCRNRTPRFAGNGTYPAGAVESADFRNNVLYNWGINNIYGGDGGQYNLVNNYYKYGPNTSSGVRYRIVTVDKSDNFPFAKYYLSGNHVDGSSANTNDNWLGAIMSSGNQGDQVLSKVDAPFLADYIPSVTHTALEAYDTVLKAAGCVIPMRDTLDDRIMNDVRNRTGRIIDVQGGFVHGTPYDQTVNAWPTLESGTPPTDTDQDGMPDEWENNNGLNPNNAADRGLFAPNGYTNLENYLNSIMGSAGTDPNPDPQGTPSTATWTLLTDQTAVVAGDLSAENQSLGASITGNVVYGSTFGTIPGWQRVGTAGLQINDTTNSYVEYKLSPANGKTFTATGVSLGVLGGGTGTARMAAFYSLDNFATMTSLGNCNYNNNSYEASVGNPVVLLNTSTTPLTGQQVASFTPSISVLPGQTLSIRFYAWITGSGTRYFPSQNVTVSGVSGDPSLPISLLSFSAGKKDGNTLLQWKIADEKDALYFEVQRSVDGVQFSPIGNVAATKLQGTAYSFTDIEKASGIVYYRLKMVEVDGKFSHSYVVSVQHIERTAAVVFPNPANSQLTVAYKQIQKASSAAVYDMMGRKQLVVNLAPNSSQTSFGTERLAKGVYVLQFIEDGVLQTIRFSKQ